MTKGFGIEDENIIKRQLSKGFHSVLDAVVFHRDLKGKVNGR